MAAAVNYAESYESSSANRTMNIQSDVSNFSRTSAVHAKPILVKTTYQIPTNDVDNHELFQSSKRLHSSTSLSSTGYDSNSSSSIVSKRNSLITNSSSNEDKHQLKPWVRPIHCLLFTSNDYCFSRCWMNRIIILRSLSRIPILVMIFPIVLHWLADRISNSINLLQALLNVVQYLSFVIPRFVHHPFQIPNQSRRIVHHRYQRNIHCKRPRLQISYSMIERFLRLIFERNITNFPINNDQRHLVQLSFRNLSNNASEVLYLWWKILFSNHHKNHRELSIKKFHRPRPLLPLPAIHRHLISVNFNSSRIWRFFTTSFCCIISFYKYKEHLISYISHSYVLGARSVSCMDLTAGVSNALFSSGLLPLQIEEKVIKENIYEELKPLPSTIEPMTSRMKSKVNPSTILPLKSSMKKGVSEPNLARGKFFSARALFDRFKRILPLSLSKQSLNESSVMTIESDDSESLSSENNDQLRLSRLDHVSRVKNVYDTLSSGTHQPSTLVNPRQLQTFYDYVVHLLPEQDLGYFANGTGCLSSSNLHHPISSSNSIRFKYPFDANEESTLKYFCFPDQHDSNNNNYHPYPNFSSYSLSKTSKPEYFRFTLTDMSGARQHGYCSRFIHKGILNALCLVSPCDMIDLYQKILSTATELFLSYKDDDARKFLKEIYPHRLPNRGDTIHIHTSTVGLYTLKCEYDRRKQLIDVSTLLRLSTGMKFLQGEE